MMLLAICMAVGVGALWLVFVRLGSDSAVDGPPMDAQELARLQPVATQMRRAEPRQERLAADQRFRSRGRLMSPAEASLFGALRLLAGEEFTVFSKVRTADVLEPVQGGREGKSAFNEISQKHLDFVVCRTGTWEIVCGIELDDSSHRRTARVARDFFVEVIFSGAGIPLVRVPARSGYSMEELRGKLGPVMQPQAMAMAA